MPRKILALACVVVGLHVIEALKQHEVAGAIVALTHVSDIVELDARCDCIEQMQP